MPGGRKKKILVKKLVGVGEKRWESSGSPIHQIRESGLEERPETVASRSRLRGGRSGRELSRPPFWGNQGLRAGFKGESILSFRVLFHKKTTP